MWTVKNAFTGLDDEDEADDETEVANEDVNKLQKGTAEQKKAVALSRLADSDDDSEGDSVKDSDDSNSDSDNSGKNDDDSDSNVSALVNNGRNGGAALFNNTLHDNKRKVKDDDFEVVPIGRKVKKRESLSAFFRLVHVHFFFIRKYLDLPQCLLLWFY